MKRFKIITEKTEHDDKPAYRSVVTDSTTGVIRGFVGETQREAIAAAQSWIGAGGGTRDDLQHVDTAEEVRVPEEDGE